MDTLQSSTIIIILHDFQKNAYQNKIVHMFSTDNELVCLVKVGMKVVKWIRIIKGASDSTKTCTYQYGRVNMSDIKPEKVLEKLRATVSVIKEDNLGLKDS